jgi:hypothetical protein
MRYFEVIDPASRGDGPVKVFDNKEDAIRYVATLCDVVYLQVREVSV